MSLINKMLQDLDSRKNPNAGSAGKSAVYDDLKPIKASGLNASAAKKRLSIIVLVIVMLGGGAYAWTQWGNHLLALVTGAVNPAPVSASSPIVAAHTSPPKVAQVAQPVIPALVAIPAPVQPPMPVTEKSSESLAVKTPDRNVVAAPVPQAEPKPDVAPVAALPSTGPENIPASKTVPATENGYWTVTEGETLYAISTKTGIDLWDLSNWNHLGSDHVVYAGQHLRLTPPVSTEAKTDAAPSPEKPQKKTAQPKKITVAAVKNPEPKVTTPPPASGEAAVDATVMDKKITPLTLDEQAESEYRQAVALLQKGHAVEAEKRLNAALKISAEHAHSRELLAGLALQKGHWREAQQILEQGIEKVPAYYPFALLLGRIHVEHGADQKALAVMERSRAAGAGNADYMTFLAELYRRTGNHAEAIKSYTEAIKLNPQEGRSWLGMGISVEATQDWKAAAAAYQRAIETGVLDENLLKYARARLDVVRNK